jgi:hypothetical protein
MLPFQPATMSTAQLAAVSYLARYSGRTHVLYSFQLPQRFTWCEDNALDPLVGIQRTHVERYIRQLADHGLMDSSIVTMPILRPISGRPIDRRDVYRIVARIAEAAAIPRHISAHKRMADNAWSGLTHRTGAAD